MENWTTIAQRTDGNTTAYVVEYRTPMERRFEIILDYDGDTIALLPEDCPRMAKVMKECLDGIVQHV
jgi:hypothetical protein